MNNGIVKQLIGYYWQLALLRAAPEDSPYSSFLMAATAMIYFFVILMQWTVMDVGVPLQFTKSLGAAISLILSYVIFNYILLSFRQVAPRLIQTLTCLFATHTLIHIFAIPLMLFTPLITQKNLANPVFFMFALVYLLLTLMLSVWELLITAHIYKSALKTSSMLSVFAAIGLNATNILTVTLWQ